MNKPSHAFNEDLWRRLLTSKQVQGLAWKIQEATQAESESRALVKMLVEKWAELVEVRQYFPDLKDVFTPDAIFYIDYTHKEGIEDWPESRRTKAARVYSVLAYISNIVARHEITPGQLILIREEEGTDDVVFARVCTITGDKVRTTGNERTHYDQPLSLVVGPVVEVNHDDCAPTKIEALRKKIAKLETDRDAWANSTKIYELETEIYNLEHPPADEEEEEEFEWPEVIGE
jgi:hypothetical protein